MDVEMAIKKNLETVKIIYRDQTIVLDKSDLLLFASYAWYTIKKHKTYYLVRNGETGIIQFHREIFNGLISKGLEVDHINGNGLDNRKENLRIVSHQINQNNQKNRDIKGTSKYLYVHWRPDRNRWCAMIAWNKKTKNLGLFTNEQEAAMVANNYIIQNKLDKILNEI